MKIHNGTEFVVSLQKEDVVFELGIGETRELTGEEAKGVWKARFFTGTKQVIDFLKKPRFEVIKKCGHVCTIEKHEEFNEKALNFLDSIHKTNTNPNAASEAV